ncbi:PIG-L deacetylase family protein [Candidatus Izemoplasma sp. B36]|uniref:PIG-L deacetylase family protein n=1 Tax=Candidatus Izemoplasma sp. B36 TaxID=3242468 RepID=UPI00355867D5
MENKEKKRVLVFAPHADDEILGVGGTISKEIKRNSSIVYICIITSGDVSMFPEKEIKKVRLEAKSAHKYLGVKETIFLDFPAVKINEVSKKDLNFKVQGVINKVKPDIVYTPHIGDIHLDHRIVTETVMVACRPINNCSVKKIYMYETLSETGWNIPNVTNEFIPNVYEDISDFIDEKLYALKKYETQLKDYPNPRSIKSIIALSQYRGSTILVDNAEAFVLIREINS